MWRTENERLGLKEISPCAYNLRSISEYAPALSALSTLACIYSATMPPSGTDTLVENLFIPLIGINGSIFGIAQLMWIANEWLLWRKRTAYDEELANYVSVQPGPFPWANCLVRLANALTCYLPWFVFDVCRHSRLNRVLHLNGKSAHLNVEVCLQRRGFGWMEQSDTSGTGRRETVSWTASADLQVIHIAMPSGAVTCEYDRGSGQYVLNATSAFLDGACLNAVKTSWLKRE